MTVIKTNIIVTIGDLACRYPNSIESRIHELYDCLKITVVGCEAHIRFKALIIISNLMLNDMIKPKANISEIVRCINDTDPKIANLSRSLLTELSKKGSNPVYNLLPDVIGKLTLEETEQNFRELMRFLMNFITKDKQIDQLVEKLCQRMKLTVTERGWRDIAFCLSLLNHNERSIRKLASLIKCYQHALQNDEVYSLISNLRPNGISKGGGTLSVTASGNTYYQSADATANNDALSSFAVGNIICNDAVPSNKVELKQWLEEWQKELDKIRMAGVEKNEEVQALTISDSSTTLVVKNNNSEILTSSNNDCVMIGDGIVTENNSVLKDGFERSIIKSERQKPAKETLNNEAAVAGGSDSDQSPPKKKNLKKIKVDQTSSTNNNNHAKRKRNKK